MQVHILPGVRNFLLVWVLLGPASLELRAAPPAPSDAVKPDVIQLTSGKTLKGLIVRQDSAGVTIQLPYGEQTVSNKDIVRILNVANAEKGFVQVLTPGVLPPWRVIANDLRSEDAIKSFQEIPATAVDTGVFKNVPYMSFRANKFYELNVYGDPADPAGIEMGIYGPDRSNPEKQKILREFLGSYLASVDEMRALYSLNPHKDEVRHVGNLVIENTPPNAPDAYGAWWISFYNEKKLNRIRLSDAEYRKLTEPMAEVLDHKGAPKFMEWQARDLHNSRRASEEHDAGRVFYEGFYRDKDGNFRLIDASGKPASPSLQ